MRLRGSSETLLPLVFDTYRAKTDPSYESTNKSIALIHFANDFVDSPVEKPKVTRVCGNKVTREFADEPVEEARIEGTNSPCAPTDGHNSVYVLVTLLPLRYKPRDHFR